MKNKAKILFVSHSTAISGGGEDDFERLLKYFSCRSEFEVYGLFPYGPRENVYSQYCVSFVCYNFGWFPYNYEGIFSYVKYFLKFFLKQLGSFRKVLKNTDFDLVVFNVGTLPLLNIFFYLYKKKQVVFIRETVKPDFFRKILFKIINLVSCSVITVSKQGAIDFKNSTKTVNPVYSVFSAVEKIDKKSLIGEGEILQSFGRIIYDNLMDKDNLKLLNIGNISPIKNQMLIINALKIIRYKNYSRVPKMFFIGDDTEKKRYINKVRNAVKSNDLVAHVFFIGRQLKPVTYKILSLVDAVVISSENEGLPLVISEAMQLGIPIICTKVGGVEDIIKDKINGLLCENNPYSLADKIENLYNNELMEKISSNSIDTAKKYFDLDKNMTQLGKIISNVI